MAKKVKEIQERASVEVQKKFNLSNFKAKKGFGAENAKYKPQAWIPLSRAWQEVTSLPGIPQGHITMLRGHSDTGKTTSLIECAVSCQKQNILPVFIITEMKWNWDFCRSMGLEFEEVVDKETGEVLGYDGFFLYVDRGTLQTVEDVAGYIADLLDEQAKGNLPYDLCFLWDSVGSVTCDQAIQSNKNNNQWTAGAISTQFGGFINQKIVMSRKQTMPYTNTLVIVNKVWVSPPETYLSAPKLNSKGGTSFYYDSTLVITYGNIANSGVTKLKIVTGGKEYEWGKRTSISIDKNHIGGVSSKGKIIMTPTGFIHADEKSIEKYRQQHKADWAERLGSEHFEMIEEDVKDEESLYDVN